VSYLPSGRLIAGGAARPQSGLGGIAILADPVFDATDPRVSGDATGQIPPEAWTFPDRDLISAVERSGSTLPMRLPGTRAEANAIRDAAGDVEVFLALGTDANRDLVLSGALERYSVIHFATHGVLDAEEPALSGLILAGVTASGAPRAWFLPSQDVAALTLDADLVVLSGCETGLGKVVGGEGLVGLSQAFLHAGAREVVSSLWRVPDKATAVLMGHFYRQLYRNHQHPVTALRLAQKEMRASRRWRDPYYWAAFIIQGDWRR
jgi:CHAT domain-containing protein